MAVVSFVTLLTIDVSPSFSQDEIFEEPTPIYTSTSRIIADGVDIYENRGPSRNEVQKGAQMELSFYIYNVEWEVGNMNYVVQVIDDDEGYATYIGTGNISLGFREERTEVVPLPISNEKPGRYIVQLFILDNLERAPQPLSPILWGFFEIV
jgi:hypothetical protein